MAKRIKKKPCKDCAWSFADICLAFPYKGETRGVFYALHKEQKDVSIENCKSMFVERMDKATCRNPGKFVSKRNLKFGDEKK